MFDSRMLVMALAGIEGFGDEEGEKKENRKRAGEISGIRFVGISTGVADVAED